MSETTGEFVEDKQPAPGLGLLMTPEARTREWTRAGLAIFLVLLLATVILSIVWSKTVNDTKDLLGVLLAPLVGLVGTATGFYYGEAK